MVRGWRNPTSPIRVAVACEAALLAEGVCGVLARDADVDVVGASHRRVEVLAAVAAKAPTVLVLEVGSPSWDAPALAHACRSALPALGIVALASSDVPVYALAMLRVGARGYLLVPAEPAQAVAVAVRSVAACGTYVSPPIAAQVSDLLVRQVHGEVGVASLSAAEVAFLRHYGRGKTMTECAADMHASLSAVCTYRRRAGRKLGLRTPEAILRFAAEQGAKG